MIVKFSECLTIDDGIDLTPNTYASDYLISPNSNSLFKATMNYSSLMPEPIQKIAYIQGKEYKIINIDELEMIKGKDDKYHAVYIWVDYNSGEYYIGKVNRPSIKEVLRYKGSGVKFKPKYEKHKNRYIRYFLCACQTREETETIEAKIVNEELLKDPFCLNIVQGGGGISAAPVSEYKRENQSKYMKEHPERYQAMLQAAKNINAEQKRQRGLKISKTMSQDSYKENFAKRMKTWRNEHPDEYQEAREKNKKAIRNPEVQKKRVVGLSNWIKNHPEEYSKSLEKIKAAQKDPEVREKHSKKMKDWITTHRDEFDEMQKRVSKTRKQKAKKVAMIDLKTGETIKVFDWLKDAGEWVVANGYSKSVNPLSTISAACKKKVIPGHGMKKSAFGFGWKYI